MHKTANTTFTTKEWECSDQGFFSTTSSATEVFFSVGLARIGTKWEQKHPLHTSCMKPSRTGPYVTHINCFLLTEASYQHLIMSLGTIVVIEAIS